MHLDACMHACGVTTYPHVVVLEYSARKMVFYAILENCILVFTCMLFDRSRSLMPYCATDGQCSQRSAFTNGPIRSFGLCMILQLIPARKSLCQAGRTLMFYPLASTSFNVVALDSLFLTQVGCVFASWKLFALMV